MYLICLLIYRSPHGFKGRQTLENCGSFPPMGGVGPLTTAAPEAQRLVFSLLSIPALRTVALPPSSGTMTPQGLQDQNSPSGETAEGIFMAWSQHSKGRPPAPHPVRGGLLQLFRVSKSPVTFIHPVAKMPGSRKDFTP